MCLGEVAQVESVDDDHANVITVAARRTVSLAVLRATVVDVGPGDWVVISSASKRSTPKLSSVNRARTGLGVALAAALVSGCAVYINGRDRHHRHMFDRTTCW